MDLCRELDAGPVRRDHDAQGCKDHDGVEWEVPMTPFLAAPCDAINDPAVCSTAFAMPDIE
jgi:hypothetical protein